jgi:hypothetical protein
LALQGYRLQVIEEMLHLGSETGRQVGIPGGQALKCFRNGALSQKRLSPYWQEAKLLYRYSGGCPGIDEKFEGGCMTVKLGINGFGRIGRCLFRAALNHPDVEVVAINDLTNPETMAHLLKYDSVHGQLNASVAAKDDRMEVDDKSIAIRSIKNPEELGWKDLNVDIVAECTGVIATAPPNILLPVPARLSFLHRLRTRILLL